MKKKQMKVQQRAYIIYLDCSPKASKRPLNAKALCERVCECAVSEAANLLSKPIINCNKRLLRLILTAISNPFAWNSTVQHRTETSILNRYEPVRHRVNLSRKYS